MEPMVGQERWSSMPFGGVALAPQNPQQQCAMALMQLHGWLQATLPQAPQLAEAIPPMVQAVRLYRNLQFEACMAQVQHEVNLVGGAGQPGRPSQ
jgi:hypothetical protein